MTGRKILEQRAASRQRADLVKGLRKLGRPGPSRPGNGAPESDGAALERCDLCGAELDHDHRHLLQLTERTILCTCESCFALRSGEPEMCPTGTRTIWFEQFEFPDELWARFGIPIGVAFIMRSGIGGVVAMYPSPAGATESPVEDDAWNELVEANSTLRTLEADGEALVVNRMGDEPEHVIAPIDECYRLVGMIKVSWDGISGGDRPEAAVRQFFSEMREAGERR